jgi:dTDP-4-dehydrorhamnose reductase
MKVLVLGASGMLGNSVVRVLAEKDDLNVFGTVRSLEVKKFFHSKISERLVQCSDVTNYNNLETIFDQIQPDVVINCISLGKSLLTTPDPLLMIPIYALLPHQLSKFCGKRGARLIQMSTDGVFSGKKRGLYKE